VAWASQSEQRQLNFIGEFGTIFVDFNNHENIQLQHNKGLETIATDFSTPPLEMEWRQLLSPLSQQNNTQSSQFPTPGATLRAARWIEQAIIGATQQIGQQQANPPRD
jgi:hypothetical protein